MDPETLQALEQLKEMWASGQIEGQPLPQEAVASRMSMSIEEFIGVVGQSEELQSLFSQMQGTPPAMATPFEAQSQLPIQGQGIPPQTPQMIPPKKPEQLPPGAGGSWLDVNRRMQG